jgi:hypothetical protein
MTVDALWRGDWQAVVSSHDANSRDPGAWLRLAIARWQEGSTDDGALQQALALGASGADAREARVTSAQLSLGQALLLTGHERQGLQVLQKALPVWVPEDQRIGRARLLACERLVAMGQWKQAEALHGRDAMQREALENSKKVLRTIHHLACTGGTVISKCIAALPGVALVSEVNPLNRFGQDFEPSNPMLLLERSYRKLTLEEIKEDFMGTIAQIVKICDHDGRRLVIRDHSHTDFCLGECPSEHTAIRDFLADDYVLLSVVTVRHPLDSFLGMLAKGWHQQFQPSTFDEYCKRYGSFLDRYEGLPLRRYEDFCREPEATIKGMCEALQLEYNQIFLKNFGKVPLTGDSGRGSNTEISLRPRRQIPAEVMAEAENSNCYHEILKRLGYNE